MIKYNKDQTTGWVYIVEGGPPYNWVATAWAGREKVWITVLPCHGEPDLPSRLTVSLDYAAQIGEMITTVVTTWQERLAKERREADATNTP